MQVRIGLACGVAATVVSVAILAQAPQLPSGPLKYGGFSSEFRADGTFTVAGAGWPTFVGTWTRDGADVTFTLTKPVRGCDNPGLYRLQVTGRRVGFSVVSDDCQPRRMILDRSTWRPEGEPEEISERRLVRTAATPLPPLPSAADAVGAWPSFRGPEARGVADGQRLPDQWNVANIRWKTSIPGLAHSSPVTWGDRVFVTSAISQDPQAGFKPGLYGDGDASADTTPHKWVILALDRDSGRIVWERVAAEGVPRNKRHIKSTYASASPATDGRTVVAWFGSEGIHAYDVNGQFRWKVDIGRIDMGAYDIPSYEWGPASSPVIWNGLVLVQCDTQADSFLVALDLETGHTVWKTERDELPSWGTPTVVESPRGPEVVTNASNFVRGYDARTGAERWRLGGSSKITAPTPFAAAGLAIVASGRAPERPIFVVRPGASGDITPLPGETASDGVAWSRTQRGAYMPTPIVYDSILYVLANNGVLDAYDVTTGEEIYRQRLEHGGSGFSASPVAADGKLYLSSEDGDIFVVAAGREFALLAKNPMGDLIMATPALSRGVMFVRTARSLIAVGR